MWCEVLGPIVISVVCFESESSSYHTEFTTWWYNDATDSSHL